MSGASALYWYSFIIIPFMASLKSSSLAVASDNLSGLDLLGSVASKKALLMASSDPYSIALKNFIPLASLANSPPGLNAANNLSSPSSQKLELLCAARISFISSVALTFP